MSNAPSEPAAIYRSLYFPLCKDVMVDESCSFNIDFWAKYKNGEYEWNWRTQILDKPTGKVREDLQQSEFLSCPLDRDEMKKLEVTYIPKPNADCLVDRFIMQQFDSNKTNREIAEDVQAEFSERFASWDSALTCVCRLAAIYAQK